MNKRMLKKAIIGAIVGTVLGNAVTGFAMYLKAVYSSYACRNLSRWLTDLFPLS